MPPSPGPHSLLLRNLPSTTDTSTIITAASQFGAAVVLLPPSKLQPTPSAPLALVDFSTADASGRALIAWLKRPASLGASLSVISDPEGRNFRAAVPSFFAASSEAAAGDVKPLPAAPTPAGATPAATPPTAKPAEPSNNTAAPPRRSVPPIPTSTPLTNNRPTGDSRAAGGAAPRPDRSHSRPAPDAPVRNDRNWTSHPRQADSRVFDSRQEFPPGASAHAFQHPGSAPPWRRGGNQPPARPATAPPPLPPQLPSQGDHQLHKSRPSGSRFNSRDAGRNPSIVATGASQRQNRHHDALNARPHGLPNGWPHAPPLGHGDWRGNAPAKGQANPLRDGRGFRNGPPLPFGPVGGIPLPPPPSLPLPPPPIPPLIPPPIPPPSAPPLGLGVPPRAGRKRGLGDVPPLGLGAGGDGAGGGMPPKHFRVAKDPALPAIRVAIPPVPAGDRPIPVSKAMVFAFFKELPPLQQTSTSLIQDIVKDGDDAYTVAFADTAIRDRVFSCCRQLFPPMNASRPDADVAGFDLLEANINGRLVRLLLSNILYDAQSAGKRRNMPQSSQLPLQSHQQLPLSAGVSGSSSTHLPSASPSQASPTPSRGGPDLDKMPRDARRQHPAPTIGSARAGTPSQSRAWAENRDRRSTPGSSGGAHSGHPTNLKGTLVSKSAGGAKPGAQSPAVAASGAPSGGVAKGAPSKAGVGNSSIDFAQKVSLSDVDYCMGLVPEGRAEDAGVVLRLVAEAVSVSADQFLRRNARVIGEAIKKRRDAAAKRKKDAAERAAAEEAKAKAEAKALAASTGAGVKEGGDTLGDVENNGATNVGLDAFSSGLDGYLRGANELPPRRRANNDGSDSPSISAEGDSDSAEKSSEDDYDEVDEESPSEGNRGTGDVDVGVRSSEGPENDDVEMADADNEPEREEDEESEAGPCGKPDEKNEPEDEVPAKELDSDEPAKVANEVNEGGAKDNGAGASVSPEASGEQPAGTQSAKGPENGNTGDNAAGSEEQWEWQDDLIQRRLAERRSRRRNKPAADDGAGDSAGLEKTETRSGAPRKSTKGSGKGKRAGLASCNGGVSKKSAKGKKATRKVRPENLPVKEKKRGGKGRRNVSKKMCIVEDDSEDDVLEDAISPETMLDDAAWSGEEPPADAEDVGKDIKLPPSAGADEADAAVVAEPVKDEETCARSAGYTRTQWKRTSTGQLPPELEAQLKAAFMRTVNQVGAGSKSARGNRQESRKIRRTLDHARLDADAMAMSSFGQRQKKLCFAKSRIHGMGLYACEDIPAGDFLVEYVGEIIRRPLADIREKTYVRQGMADAYLFRLSNEYVVDATRKGSIARFINHSCDPSVRAEVIRVNQSHKIVFYTLKAVKKGDELTYDYKFPIEDETSKVPCYCGSAICRGTLN